VPTFSIARTASSVDIGTVVLVADAAPPVPMVTREEPSTFEVSSDEK
jgi:hypothetical protein